MISFHYVIEPKCTSSKHTLSKSNINLPCHIPFTCLGIYSKEINMITVYTITSS